MHQKPRREECDKLLIRCISFFLFCVAVIPIQSFAITPVSDTTIETPADPSPEDLVVEFDKDRITVVANKARLNAVLSKISAATGISFYVNGPAGLFISDNFSNIPIERAIKRLAKGYNCAFIYARKDPNMKSPVLSSAFIYLSPTDSFLSLGETIIPTLEPTSDSLISDSISSDMDESASEFEQVKEAALEGEKEALSTLIDISLNGENEELRLASIETLGSIGQDQQRAMDALVRALSDGDARVRTASVRSIGQYDAEKALDALEYALQDPSREVRVEAMLVIDEKYNGEQESYDLYPNVGEKTFDANELAPQFSAPELTQEAALAIEESEEGGTQDYDSGDSGS